ncbi:hypothetical protein C8Q76DRAFT_718059 [Earliella scabrosa]|nr:hypothetical protein C8Q76DRAFT_718059 [Earliella scabrosa]
MPSLAILSPINESEELSPYRTPFGYARYPGQRSPIGTKGSFQYVRDAAAGPSSPNPEVTMDDLWIYDCYASEDSVSPGGYPRTPVTPSHNRSISLPATTANFVPPNNIPLIKEPTPAPHRPPALSVPSRDMYGEWTVPITEDPDDLAYTGVDLDLPVINTAVYSPVEYREYSPLEQESLSTWEVIDQLASVVDLFSGLESVLSHASTSDPPPEVDEDTVFWFIEALNLFVGDCTEVAMELMRFSEFVQALLMGEREGTLAPMRTLHRASFSEQEFRDVLGSAASIPEFDVSEALAELEASVPPSPIGMPMPRERPTSLKLSTADAVLLSASLQPRSRLQSVGALARFSDHQGNQERPEESTLRKHRAYVVVGASPIEDDWSAKSIVEFQFGEGGEQQPSPSDVRPRPTSGQSTIPRPLSSPVRLEGKSFTRGRPPSLSLSDPHSPRSSHSTSSSVSSLFSNLPRSSFTTASSPRSSPRQSITFDKGDKARFPTSSVKFKKMFTNIFKNKDGSMRTPGSLPAIPATIRNLGRRNAGTGSIDATLSALSLSGMSTPSSLPPDRDPFAASPPPSASLQTPRSPDMSGLDGYSSMFASLKAASTRLPQQPLFGGIEHDRY